MAFDANARPSQMMTTIRPGTVARTDRHTAPRMTGAVAA